MGEKPQGAECSESRPAVTGEKPQGPNAPKVDPPGLLLADGGI